MVSVYGYSELVRQCLCLFVHERERERRYREREREEKREREFVMNVYTVIDVIR